MKTVDWKSLLGRHQLFSSLGEDEIARLLEMSNEKDYQEGHVILREGELADSIFLIGSGVVSVVLQRRDGEKVTISTLGSGEFFGEMALLDQRPRSATVIVEERCSLLEIKGDEFLKLMHGHPGIEFQVLLKLSERLRHASEQVLALKLNDVDERINIFSTKLDARLEAADAQMKAARTVFEQTTTRANEIIESAERSRSRLTTTVSTIGGILAIAAALGGSITYFNVQGIIEEVTESVEQANDDAASIHETKIDLEGVDERIEEIITLNVKRFNDLRSKFYKQILLPRFAHEVRTERQSAIETYKTILEIEEQVGIEKQKLTDELFKVIISDILASTDWEDRDNYRAVLRTGINASFTKNPRQRTLSNYFLLALLAIDGEIEEFQISFENFNKFLHKYEGKSIKKSMEKFDPVLFEANIDAMKLDEKTSNSRKRKIRDVWEQIP